VNGDPLEEAVESAMWSGIRAQMEWIRAEIASIAADDGLTPDLAGRLAAFLDDIADREQEIRRMGGAA
jgi:hypothetical protein